MVPARYAVRFSVSSSPAMAQECTRSALTAGRSSAYPKRPNPWATAAASTTTGMRTRGPHAELLYPGMRARKGRTGDA
jgi:hypothetical protein